MNALKTIWLTTALAASLFAGLAADASPSTANGMSSYERSSLNSNTDNRHLYPQDMGGDDTRQNQEAPTDEEFGPDLAKQGTPMLTDIISSAGTKVKLTKAAKGQMKADFPWKGKAATERLTAAAALVNQQIADKELVGKLSEPGRWVKPAQAAAQAQATNAGNAAAEVSRDQASSAIDFCAHYLHNFTVDGGNKWNLLRNNIFVPMGILLLLPGALLTQLRAIMAAGNPVLGNINPLEGIMRSVIAIFLIPGTYLVVNYSIDLSNSITFTINSEYFRLFGSDMYKDAICAEIRAFPVRGEQENRNALDLPVPTMTPLVNPGGLFAQFEGMMENKIEDPCSNLYQAPGARADEAMTSSSIAARLGLNGSNAALTASWNILCAFQMAYLYYLWFVGPVAAGLWVWPMKQLRGALPSWVEGVITLAFWSLFWNTAILLIACFKGVGETGCVLMTALHFLATASVKHAFDFAGLVRAAGQEAANMAEKAMKSGGAGGGGGGGGGCGGGASKGGSAQGQGAAAGTAEGIGATSSNVASSAGTSGASVSPVAVASSNTGFGSDSDAARVRAGGLGETLSPRKDSKDDGIVLASYTGASPFGDKTGERGVDGGLPPSEKKEDVSLDRLLENAPAFFCSTDVDASASNLDQTEENLLAMNDTDWTDMIDMTDASTQAGDDFTNLTASDSSTKTSDGTTVADASGLPPSAATLAEREAAKLAHQEEMKQELAARAEEKAKEVAEAHRQSHAEHVMSSLSAAVASASHVGGVLGAGASVLNAGANVLNAASNLDVSNALTNIASANNNVSAPLYNSESLTQGDSLLAKMEAGDIYDGSIDAINAVDVDNSFSVAAANPVDGFVSNPTLSAQAAVNTDQYSNVTAYGGVVPAGSVDQSTLVSANTNNAYTATDSYGAPLVTNTSGVPAMVGNQIDASSNPVYSAQAMTGNPVVAAVENYNTIPTGVHSTNGTSEFYAAPAVSGNYVASAQSTTAYSADYSTQATPVASNSNYSVDYSQSTPVTQQQQQGTPVFASVLPSSTPVDYAAPAQTITGTQSGGNVEYYSAQAAPAQTITGTQSGGNVEYYSAQAAPAQATVASANSYVDQSSFSAAHAQFASTQYATNSAQYESNPQYATNAAQYESNPQYAANSTQYAANTAQYDSSSTQYAANTTQYAANSTQYDSSSTQYAANSTQYDSSSTQYAANSTQYAPQQGQPSSFIQPSAPANEYYAAPSQSAPLIAALITPNQSSAIEVASVQGQQQSYSSPVQYYLANANTQPEHRSVENIAPVERAPQQSSDVVYSRSNSDAYTTVTPYSHVENTEPRPVSFAPASSQNVQHGPQAVTQYEAVLSQQQVHNKVQQAQGLISRMNTILSGFDAPHAVGASGSNEVKTVSVAQPVVQNQEPANEVVTKKSLSDLLPVQRKAKAPPKEEMVVAPPPMSNSWFDA